ncbi:MAG: energy-coupling factor transporter transmembrane protein EcfT [Rhodocyclaceae bacterium]|jgi:energy-coupling factor transport system permease protein|nr:energy-coupling factor transporter transmembrane protein EcfT [Rhodocyclaceae bacterium]
MFHPASLLLVWGVSVLAIQQLDLSAAAVATFCVLLIAAWVSRPRLLKILHRTRWLFLSLLVLFPWLTPGVRLEGHWAVLGVSVEGVEMAVEHGLRLLAILAMLSLLLNRLDHADLVAGLFMLMAPMARLGLDRQRIAVRLMLTLEYAVEGGSGGWRGLLSGVPATDLAPRCLVLNNPDWKRGDSALVVLAVAVAVLLRSLG